MADAVEQEEDKKDTSDVAYSIYRHTISDYGGQAQGKLEKVVENPAGSIVLNAAKFALSFVVDIGALNPLLSSLGLGALAGDDFRTNLKNYMGKKFEKLSEGARESCVDFFTTAVISLRCEKYDDARDKFKELQSKSMEAFNASGNIDSWIVCTRFKIVSTLMKIGLEGGMKKGSETAYISSFNELDKSNQIHIAKQTENFIDQLLEKREEKIAENEASARKSNFYNKKKNEKEAKKKNKELVDKVDQLLKDFYPIISEGLELTDQHSCSEFQDIKIMPKYVPEGEEDQTEVIISSKPLIGLKLFKTEELDVIRWKLSKYSMDDDSPSVQEHDISPWTAQEIDTAQPILNLKLGDLKLKLGEILKSFQEKEKQRSLDEADRLHKSGLACFNKKKYDEAELHYKKALDIRSRILGDHEDTASTLNNLGTAYYHQGKFSQAEEKLKKSLEMRRKLFGEKHDDIARSLYNLGLVYWAQSQWGKAVDAFKESYEMYTNDPDLKEEARKQLEICKTNQRSLDEARRLHKSGYYCYNQNKYDEAESYYKKALDIQSRILGDHQSTAMTQHNLGLLYQNKKKYDEAVSYYKKALDIEMKILGDHDHTANTLNNLGDLYRLQRKFSEAEEKLKKSLEMRRKLFGEKHPNSIAQSLFSLGAVYKDQSQWRKAVDAVKEAYEMFEDPDMKERARECLARSLYHLGVLYGDQGQWRKAVDAFKESYEMYKDPEAFLKLEFCKTQL